jgi:hypothetical protein
VITIYLIIESVGCNVFFEGRMFTSGFADGRGSAGVSLCIESGGMPLNYAGGSDDAVIAA